MLTIKNDKSILTYDKTNGLNDAGISFIAWNKSTKRLVIVYSNNNIDLLGEKRKCRQCHGLL